MFKRMVIVRKACRVFQVSRKSFFGVVIGTVIVVLIIYGQLLRSKKEFEKKLDNSRNARVAVSRQSLSLKVETNFTNAADKHHQRNERSSMMKAGEHTKHGRFNLTILAWRRPYDIPTEGFTEGPIKGGCHLTYDQTTIRKAVAVIFEYTSLRNEGKHWNHYRRRNQVYVWHCMESPASMRDWFHVDLSPFNNNFINWTMTYRTDSDVYGPYVSTAQLQDIFNKIGEQGKSDVDAIISNKKRIALWVVSNCDGSKGAKSRMDYVMKLMQDGGLPVDHFGKCFNNKEEYAKMPHETSMSYRFYLAFENSRRCRDYVTEKFWHNAILAGRVPVVWGPSKEDVKRIAPPGSFIHADDFASPKLLAKYLIYLSSNDTAYREYFKWREISDNATINFVTQYQSVRLENLCRQLQDIYTGKTNLVSKSIPSITKYWYASEKTECYRR